MVPVDYLTNSEKNDLKNIINEIDHIQTKEEEINLLKKIEYLYKIAILRYKLNEKI